MPSIKDFAASKGSKLKNEAEQKWAITHPRQTSDQRRRPGRGIDAVLSLHKQERSSGAATDEAQDTRQSVSLDDANQIETNRDTRMARKSQMETNRDTDVSSKSQMRTNGDSGAETDLKIETNRDEPLLMAAAKVAIMETNRDNELCVSPLQIETKGDKEKSSGGQQIETNEDGATGVIREIETNEDKKEAVVSRDQIETNEDRRPSEATQFLLPEKPNPLSRTGKSGKLGSKEQEPPDEAEHLGSGRQYAARPAPSPQPEKSQAEIQTTSHSKERHRSSPPLKSPPKQLEAQLSGIVKTDGWSRPNAILRPPAADAPEPRSPAERAVNETPALAPSPSVVGSAPSNEDKQTLKWRQSASQLETNEDTASIDQPFIGDKPPGQMETTEIGRHLRPPHSAVQGIASGNSTISKGRQIGTNRDRSAFVSISDDQRLHLSEQLSPLESSDKWRHVESVSKENAVRLHLQIETGSTSKWRQPAQLPTGSQARLILSWLARNQLETGLGHTRRIKRPEIAEALKIALKSVAKQLSRLIDAGHLVRVDGRRGRGESGAVFIVPEAAQVASTLAAEFLKWRQPASSNGDNKWRHQAGSGDVVSSLSINTTTTPDPDTESIDDALRLLVNRFRLDAEFSVTTNELRKAMRSSGLDLKLFAQSVEHLVFYLRSPLAKGINHARAWFIKMLSTEYFDEPIGFVSWEDNQLRKQLAAQEAKLARTRQLQRQLFDTSYDNWFEEQTDDDLSKAARKQGFEGLKRATLKPLLRIVYAELSGQELPEAHQAMTDQE